MKLATFSHAAGARVGIIEGDRVIDATAATGLATMLEVIEGGESALETLRLLQDGGSADTFALADVSLLSPLVPSQMRDYGCFPGHFLNILRARSGDPDAELPPIFYERPLYYLVNRLCVVGHDTDVKWPAYSKVFDYELEWACVIGRSGSDIAREDAHEHIFGYTIFNDFTARDTQSEELTSGLGMSKGKDFDSANVLGPWIVTRDELADPYSLQMRARIGGDEVSSGSSAAMHHLFEDMIAFTSQSTTLHPGEVLCSGTVPTGCGAEHGRYLQPGETVELEVEGIGVLRNRVVA